MCLILFSYDQSARYKLVLAANRDEFYDRPTRGLHFWGDHPDILAGRDLKGNGTWLGITGNGRLAAITNYRDPSEKKPGAPSRGRLVSDYLTGDDPPRQYLENIAGQGNRYCGFNLMVGMRRPCGIIQIAAREYNRSLRGSTD